MDGGLVDLFCPLLLFILLPYVTATMYHNGNCVRLTDCLSIAGEE